MHHIGLQENNYRAVLRYDNLHLDDFQLQNYTLSDMEQILIRSGRNVYDAVIDSVLRDKGDFLFVYGHGGTGKTYLWKTIICRLRSEGKIVIAVASSGIAALLLPGGRTAHSRFQIPIIVIDNSTCGIKQGSQIAELVTKASLIIWDEAPMTHRNCFEAVDRSLRDILCFTSSNSVDKPFGGKTVVLGGDFRQILLVIAKGRREQIVEASINKSSLWNDCRVFILTKNMRLTQNPDDVVAREFAEWILKIGDGELNNSESEALIEIPHDLLIQPGSHPFNDIVNATYPDFQTKFNDSKYLQERAILAPTNEVVEDINNYMIDLIDADEETYLSANSICKASTNILDQDVMYPTELLNSLKFPGIPNHKLRLKVGLPIMLLHNLNQSAGLCNGTRLLVTQLSKWVLEAQIISGSHIGDKVFIPRIVLSPSESKWPFVLKRRQFPVSVCFTMTINKSQGQSLKCVGLYLDKPVFSHGQLYVAVSRVTSRNGLRILIAENDNDDHFHTKNIVYKEIFNDLPTGNTNSSEYGVHNFEAGDYQLSSTFATKLYVNLDIPEVAEIRNRLNSRMDIYVKEIQPKGLLKVQDGELALHNRKTIAEIKDLEWNSETKDSLVTCNANIINIYNKYGWYYVACLICKTKVKQVKGVLWCECCKNEPKFAVPSYRIQVQVQDKTDSTTFTLFDKGAKKIISKTAKELAEMQTFKLDENILPKEIQKIIGKEYLFQLHLDEYNLKYGKENYTASKILETEISHKHNSSHEVEEYQDTMEENVRKSRKDKYTASQKKEIGETSVERPEFTAPITTEDGRPGHKRRKKTEA
ncbi:hypothetical protein SO802_009894 [Lithocarpus litseifolius]|uniref:ATP-dependent DNA helicase n=1 Tax=Lithocarpus litseifolius TaxID=425828 RepID=A0AAW2DCS1_9ROSI